MTQCHLSWSILWIMSVTLVLVRIFLIRTYRTTPSTDLCPSSPCPLPFGWSWGFLLERHFFHFVSLFRSLQLYDLYSLSDDLTLHLISFCRTRDLDWIKEITTLIYPESSRAGQKDRYVDAIRAKKTLRISLSFGLRTWNATKL